MQLNQALDQTSLQSVSFFHWLEPEWVQTMEEESRKIEFKKGTTLFKEGTQASSCYLIQSGRVILLQHSKDGGEEVLRELGPGYMTGLSTLTGGNELASSKVVEPISVLAWNQTTLDSLYLRYPELKKYLQLQASVPRTKRSLISHLRKTAFFHSVSPVLLRWLLDSAGLIPVQAGSTVFKEGDAGEAFYLILEGAINIFREKPTKQLLDTLYSGSGFGELALLNSAPRNATAQALKDSTLLIIGQREFGQLQRLSASFRKTVHAISLERALEPIVEDYSSEVVLLLNHSRLANTDLSQPLARSLREQCGGSTFVVDVTTDEALADDMDSISGDRCTITLKKVKEFFDLLSKAGHSYIVVSVEPSIEVELAEKLNHEIQNCVYIYQGSESLFPYDRSFAGFVHFAPIVEHHGTHKPDLGIVRGMVPLHRGRDGANHADFQRCVGRLARAILRRQVGVALGGGGAWGFAHLSLLRTLNDLNIPVDMVSGASFGSVVGAFYSAFGLGGLDKLVSLQRSLSAAVALTPFSSWSVEKFIDHHIPESSLEYLAVPFFPVAVNILDGREKVFRKGSIAKAVRASGAFPGVFGPVWYNGQKYVDGGVMNNVPATILAEEGADFIISSNVVPSPKIIEHRRVSPVKKAIDHFWLPERIRDSIRSIYILLKAAGENQAKGSNFTFSPDLMDFMPMDFGSHHSIIQAGLTQLEPQKEKLKELYRSFCEGDLQQV